MKLTYSSKYAYNKAYFEENRERIYERRKVRRNSTVNGRMIGIIGNAGTRAKKEGFEFDLTKEFLIKMWDDQKGLCAITGTPMSLFAEETRHSNLVSLDRIDANKGYTVDNVWLVCSKINYAKGVQSYEEFVEMCKAVVENAK